MPGDLGFDPIGFSTGQGYVPSQQAKFAGEAKEELQTAEIKHGRLAMLAITGFAVQEFLWGSPVVQQTPWFFGR